VSADGETAVAADPDRNRVSIVNLTTGSVQHVPLEAGDEPGRVVLDPAGRAFVALRHSGALAVIDLASASLVQRIPICATPRGLAFDVTHGLLHVACMEGRLVSLRNRSAVEPAATQPTATALELALVNDVQVELDLRDVMLQGDQLWVSTFKRAELLQVGEGGQVRQRISPQRFSAVDVGLSVGPTQDRSAQNTTMQPHLAYRSFADAAGNKFILHQGASDGEVATEPPEDGQSGSPYGGFGGCGGIVTPVVTTIDANGNVKTAPAATGVLSIDMAFAPEDNVLAVVQAGARDSRAPQRQTFFDHDDGLFGSSAPASLGARSPSFGVSEDGMSGMVTILDLNAPEVGCKFGATFFVPAQATAIAFRPRTGSAAAVGGESGWVVQSREPARLYISGVRGELPNGQQVGQQQVIDLGGESVRDSGHEIFHRDAGGGIACASCHAEGGEDGHVWNFTSLGARRTQALHIGLEGTAPFHWGGDESDLDNLMSDVFVGRMGGVHQSVERVSALSRWLFALQPPAAPSALDTAAVERGQVLFMSAAVGCNECHNGLKLTNNKNVNVGRGAALQVPSLRGIAYRAPFMHDGCAATLRDRFSPDCGGESHGKTRQLPPQSIDDLVAYLQTL
jgi:mono/diheme cytochrome c family protein